MSDKESDLKIQRQMYQMHKEGYKQIAEAFQGLSKVDIVKLKGDPGYTPKKGVDYYTEAELKQIYKKITDNVMSLIKIPEPIPGKDAEPVDYKKIRSYVKNEVSKIKIPEPEPGKDAVVDYDKVVSNVLRQIPEPDTKPLKDYIDKTIKDLDLESMFGRRLLNSSGPTTRLGEMVDVDLDDVQNNYGIFYDSENRKWVARDPSTADPVGLQEVTDNGSTTTNSITANSFIKSGGTSSQFLKADGSTDSKSYVDSARLDDTATGASGTDLVGIPALAGATWTTQTESNNLFSSAGRATGGNITDAGSQTVDVAAGTGFIKAVDSDTAEVLAFDWSASTGISIPNDSIRYIGIEYNAGSPQVVSRTTDNWNFDTEFPLGTVVNEAGLLHIINAPWWISDGFTNIIERFSADGRITRDQKIGGLILSVTGTRNIAHTAGTLWSRLTEFEESAFDTSVSGSFELAYRDGSGGWTITTGNTQYPVTQYDDGSGTLQNLTTNKYANWWVFLATDGDVTLVYPQAEFTTAAQAEEEEVPASLPDAVTETAIFMGRITFRKGVDTPVDVTSAFSQQLRNTAATDHGNLAGLTDDDHPQYLRTDGTRALTGNWNVGANNITSTGTLTGEQLTSTDQADIANELAVGTTSGKIIIGDITGNARGTGAIDIQKRSLATQVASGTNSTAVGRNNTVSSDSSFAIGESNSVSGASTSGSVGSGNTVTSSYGNNFAIGVDNTINSYSDSTVLGKDNSSFGYYGQAIIGFNNYLNGEYGGLVLGIDNNVSGESIVIGDNNNVTTGNSVIIGADNTVSVNQALVLGQSLSVSGTDSVSLGKNIISTSDNSVTSGINIRDNNESNTSFGNSLGTNGELSVNIGYGNKIFNNTTGFFGAFDPLKPSEKYNFLFNKIGIAHNQDNVLEGGHFDNVLATDKSESGSEIISDTSMETGWTFGTGWSQYTTGGGTFYIGARKESDGSGTLSTSVSLTAGKYYVLDVTIGAFSVGTLDISIGGHTFDTFYGGDEPFSNDTPLSLVFKASSSADLVFTPSNNSRIARLYGLSLKEIQGGNLLAPAGYVQTGVYTVANLPAVGTAGRRAMVSDANSTTFASVVAGGGSNTVPVFDDGTNWRIG